MNKFIILLLYAQNLRKIRNFAQHSLAAVSEQSAISKQLVGIDVQ